MLIVTEFDFVWCYRLTPFRLVFKEKVFLSKSFALFGLKPQAFLTDEALHTKNGKNSLRLTHKKCH